jgi:hypothetical protein
MSIFLLVLGIGLKATPRHATHLLRHPGQLVRSLAATYLVMPPFAVAAALAFDLHPAVKIALVAVAVSPVPPFLPLKATKAGGARNYTIGLLVAASAFAVVLVPLAVELVGAVFGKPFAMPVTGTAGIVTLSVLAPLAVGMALRQFAPSIAELIARPVATASVALLVLALVPVLLNAWLPILLLAAAPSWLSRRSSPFEAQQGICSADAEPVSAACWRRHAAHGTRASRSPLRSQLSGRQVRPARRSALPRHRRARRRPLSAMDRALKGPGMAMEALLHVATQHAVVLIDWMALVLIAIGTIEAFVNGLRAMLA